MNYYIMEPEVAGEIGYNTIYQNSERTQISHLHFIFDGWLGDEILETTPCFLVSERLKGEIIKNGLSGYIFQEVEISYSDEFLELYPNIEMPNFFRLIPTNILYVEDNKYRIQSDMRDFMISPKSYMVISEKVKNIITLCNAVNNADFTLLSLEVCY